MQISIEQIFEAALALPPEARACLADRLVESLDPAGENPHPALWQQEVRRRIEDVRTGRVQTIPGDEAPARVRRAMGL